METTKESFYRCVASNYPIEQLAAELELSEATIEKGFIAFKKTARYKPLAKMPRESDGILGKTNVPRVKVKLTKKIIKGFKPYLNG